MSFMENLVSGQRERNNRTFEVQYLDTRKETIELVGDEISGQKKHDNRTHEVRVSGHEE